MGKQRIIQYWHSSELPEEVTEMTATFRELNPSLHHRVFCEEEAEEFIATHFTSRELAAFRSCAVPAMQADYFRYCAVLALGGVYSDVDFRCLQALQPLIESADRGLLARGRHEQVINGFFLFKQPDHPLLGLTLDLATAHVERRVDERVWAVTGPGIFRGLSALHRIGSPAAVQQEFTHEGIRRRLRSLLDSVGDYGRITEAFEGVRIIANETASEWIDTPPTPPLYKRSEMDWVNWQKQGRSIFRRPRRRDRAGGQPDPPCPGR
jgi:Glycosyltransferase sugar-binding region containing DXD motif